MAISFLLLPRFNSYEVRLKVTDGALFAAIDARFNSYEVRLKARIQLRICREQRRFNSYEVRLKVCLAGVRRHLRCLFQFL